MRYLIYRSECYYFLLLNCHLIKEREIKYSLEWEKDKEAILEIANKRIVFEMPKIEDGDEDAFWKVMSEHLAGELDAMVEELGNFIDDRYV